MDGLIHHYGCWDAYTEKVIVVLRDGKKIIGVLRSYDQYGKPVLLSSSGYTPD